MRKTVFAAIAMSGVVGVGAHAQDIGGRPSVAAADPDPAHVDFGRFDSRVEAREAWAEIVEEDPAMLEMDPEFVPYLDDTTLNVFSVPLTDAQDVCEAADAADLEQCEIFK